jgi:hypothetical protein
LRPAGIERPLSSDLAAQLAQTREPLKIEIHDDLADLKPAMQPVTLESLTDHARHVLEAAESSAGRYPITRTVRLPG